MYSVLEIAEWFLHKEQMTHKKLQKLCYYAYAWYYALKGEVLFNDTSFEAWVHGPVSPTLYCKYKGNGWTFLSPQNAEPEINQEVKEILESVWYTYGDQTGNSLEALSHSELPWIEARRGLDPWDRGSHDISLDTIRSFYLSIYDGDDV